MDPKNAANTRNIFQSPNANLNFQGRQIPQTETRPVGTVEQSRYGGSQQVVHGNHRKNENLNTSLSNSHRYEEFKIQNGNQQNSGAGQKLLEKGFGYNQVNPEREEPSGIHNQSQFSQKYMEYVQASSNQKSVEELREEDGKLKNFIKGLQLKDINTSREMVIEFANKERQLQEQNQQKVEELARNLKLTEQRVQQATREKDELEAEVAKQQTEINTVQQKLVLEEQNVQMARHELTSKRQQHRSDNIKYAGKHMSAQLKHQEQMEELRNKTIVIENLNTKLTGEVQKVITFQKQVDLKNGTLKKLEEIISKQGLQFEQSIEEIKADYLRQITQISKESELKFLKLNEELNNTKLNEEVILRQKNEALNMSQQHRLTIKGLQSLEQQKENELFRKRQLIQETRSIAELEKSVLNHRIELQSQAQAVKLDQEQFLHKQQQIEQAQLQNYKNIQSKEKEISMKSQSSEAQLRTRMEKQQIDLAKREEMLHLQFEQLKSEKNKFEHMKIALREDKKRYDQEVEENKNEYGRMRELEKQISELKMTLQANNEAFTKDKNKKFMEQKNLSQQFWNIFYVFLFIATFAFVMFCQKLNYLIKNSSQI